MLIYPLQKFPEPLPENTLSASSPQTLCALNKTPRSGAAHLSVTFLKGRAVSPPAGQGEMLLSALQSIWCHPCAMAWGCWAGAAQAAAHSCSSLTLPSLLVSSSHAVLSFAGLLNQSRNSILPNIQSARLFFRPSAGS